MYYNNVKYGSLAHLGMHCNYCSETAQENSNNKYTVKYKWGHSHIGEFLVVYIISHVDIKYQISNRCSGMVSISALYSFLFIYFFYEDFMRNLLLFHASRNEA